MLRYKWLARLPTSIWVLLTSAAHDKTIQIFAELADYVFFAQHLPSAFDNSVLSATTEKKVTPTVRPPLSMLRVSMLTLIPTPYIVLVRYSTPS